MFYIYNLLGSLLLVWYTHLRWAFLGNEFAKIIIVNNVTTIKLNWWQAVINILTALASMVFLVYAIFGFKDSLKSEWMYYLSIILLIRNIGYTITDIWEFLAGDNTLKQAMYIAIDIAMALIIMIWRYYRMINL